MKESAKKQYAYIRKTTTFLGRRYEVRGKTEVEAAEKLQALKARLQQGEQLPSGDMTVDQWYQKWMKTYKVPAGLTAKSLRLYEEKYRGYIQPAIGNLLLREVRDFQLQEIMNGQAEMSYSHVSKLRMVLQELFRQARRSRLILFDPAEGLFLPVSVRRTRRSITEEERHHILALAEEHPAGLWVLTLLYTGLRPGETAALLWENVDFDTNELHVTQALESGGSALRPPKTPAGIRDVPLCQTLREKLWAVRGAPEEPVFRNAAGNRHSHSSLYRLWVSFARALDLRMGDAAPSKTGSALTPYCLRHTFCTDLQRAGVSLNVAKELMGHADISVTANIYTHRDRRVLHDSIARLEAVQAPEA